MTALPRLQQALVDAHPRHRRASRVLAAAAVAGAAAFAVTVFGGAEPDPERVAAPPVPVAIGQPVDPVPAGDPPEGWIEMRAVDPVSGEALAGLYFTYRGDPCWEVGPERAYREYPVRDGGSCSTGGGPPGRLSMGVSSSSGQATFIDGTVRDDVERLTIDGLGAPRDVPLSAHGGWFVAVAPSFEGNVRITAHLRDGGRLTEAVSLPMAMPPPPVPPTPTPGP